MSSNNIQTIGPTRPSLADRSLAMAREFGRKEGRPEDEGVQIVERIRHYFLTYKNPPGEETRCQIPYAYDRRAAQGVINAAITDYNELLASNR